MSAPNLIENDHFRPWHLSQDAYYEVQRTNNFAVVLDFNGNDELSVAQDWLMLAVESCPLPDISNGEIELAYQNSKVKVAGQAEFGNFDLVVKDAIKKDVELLLWEWRAQVYNPKNGKIGWAEKYKHNGYIYQYAPDGTHARGWRIVGVWPTNLQLGDLNYDGGDKKTITMSLAVDFAWPLERDWTASDAIGTTNWDISANGDGTSTFSGDSTNTYGG